MRIIHERQLLGWHDFLYVFFCGYVVFLDRSNFATLRNKRVTKVLQSWSHYPYACFFRGVINGKRLLISWAANSHLSNKREVTLTDFEKKNPPSRFIDFLDFFHPPLLVYCSYVLVFSKNSHPPRLFKPPRLLERWEYIWTSRTISTLLIQFGLLVYLEPRAQINS